MNTIAIEHESHRKSRRVRPGAFDLPEGEPDAFNPPCPCRRCSDAEHAHPRIRRLRAFAGRSDGGRSVARRILRLAEISKFCWRNGMASLPDTLFSSTITQPLRGALEFFLRTSMSATNIGERELAKRYWPVSPRWPEKRIALVSAGRCWIGTPRRFSSISVWVRLFWTTGRQ